MNDDPVAMRRQLVADLKRLRAERGLTQRQVADELDWSPSKIIRIEKASVGIGVTDLHALLRLYGVEDEATIDSYLGKARRSKRQPFNEYRAEFPPETLRYFRYESSASIIRQFEPVLVPGLLQTEEYGRALLGDFGIPDERAEGIWAARAERQELLDRADPPRPEMFFILGEAVVRQTVGSDGVMQRQRDRLVELNARPGISIQVIPFSANAHRGMLGPFTYLAFEGTDDPNVLYSEGTLGDSVIRDDEEFTARYLDYLFALEQLALPATELEDFLSSL